MTQASFTYRQVLRGWVRHMARIKGLDIRPLPRPVLSQSRYGKAVDGLDLKMFVMVEEFFTEHEEFFCEKAALLIGQESENFRAQFKRWYNVAPMAERDEVERAFPIADAAAVWNIYNPQDPITHDALRKAQVARQVAFSFNDSGWIVVTLGAIAVWRANCKHGGARPGAGRPKKVAA